MSQKRLPKYCWGCGADLKETQKFCTKCGKSVIPNKNNSAELQSEGRNPPIQTQSNTNTKSNSIPFGHQPLYGQKAPNTAFFETDPAKNLTQPTNNVNSFNVEKIDQLEQKIDNMDIEKKFEKIEYKLNALFGEVHFEDSIKEIKNIVKKIPSNEGIENLTKKIDAQQKQYDEKFSLLAKSEDLEEIKMKIASSDMSAVEGRLKSIENRLVSNNLEEKVQNLAKNTVERLNSIETKVDNFNLENRKRLVKIDERIEGFEAQFEKINNNLTLLVPSLVKLTEKVNKLANSSAPKNTQVVTKTTMSKKPSINLPPFPDTKTKTKDMI